MLRMVNKNDDSARRRKREFARILANLRENSRELISIRLEQIPICLVGEKTKSHAKAQRRKGENPKPNRKLL